MEKAVLSGEEQNEKRTGEPGAVSREEARKSVERNVFLAMMARAREQRAANNAGSGNVGMDNDDEVSEDHDDYDDYDDDDDDDGMALSEAGKRVVLRCHYKNDRAYACAVVRLMQDVLESNGVRKVGVRAMRDDVKLISFDRTTRGIDVDCHVLCEYGGRFSYTIVYIVNVKNLPGRIPLIDHFCQDKSFSLRYGAFALDHRDGQKTLQYAASFAGAFSEEAFDISWRALDATLGVFVEEYQTVAGAKKLKPEHRKTVRRMIGELAENLPARVKPENEARFARVMEVIGDEPRGWMKRLVNYIVELTA